LVLSKTVKNVSWIIVCRILQSLLNLLIGMITARYLGPSNYGLIAYAASISAFFIPLVRLGFNSTLVQEFVADPEGEGEILGTSLVLNILSGLLSVIGVAAFCLAAHPGDTETILVCLLYSLTLPLQASEMTQYWFHAKLLSKYPSLSALIAYIVISGYKIAILISGKTVYWFAVTHVIEAAIVSALLMILYRRHCGRKLSFSLIRGKTMLARSKYYILSGMAVTILLQTDRLMLKNIVSDTVTGYYSAAVTCAGIFGFVYAAIIDSMRPQILKQKQISEEKFEEAISSLYSLIFYLSLAQCIVTFLLAETLVLILYGEEYLPAADVLRVGVWFVTYSYFGCITNIWLLGEKKDHLVVFFEIFGAVANILLNILFIPPFGAIGAAAASLITQFSKNFLLGFLIPPLRHNNLLILRGLNPRYAWRQIRELCRKKPV